jgi:hypothetical protein
MVFGGSGNEPLSFELSVLKTSPPAKRVVNSVYAKCWICTLYFVRRVGRVRISRRGNAAAAKSNAGQVLSAASLRQLPRASVRHGQFDVRPGQPRDDKNAIEPVNIEKRIHVSEYTVLPPPGCAGMSRESQDIRTRFEPNWSTKGLLLRAAVTCAQFSSAIAAFAAFTFSHDVVLLNRLLCN